MTTFTKKLFRLGHIVITPSALARLSQPAVLDGLRRHASGDWGSLPGDDAQLNEDALQDGGRIFSAYGEGSTRFWVITEADRSMTTILMPEDY
ncbi:MAG TPA: hypothetical protein VHQ47_06125 [Phycisphaerae bacterium]|jgi:hypothetical protein|nr:hypothetical protein [Phycisphaerae bacterium]HWB99724.1 hypothetical protein [Bryobacteraceae bacterium]